MVLVALTRSCAGRSDAAWLSASRITKRRPTDRHFPEVEDKGLRIPEWEWDPECILDLILGFQNENENENAHYNDTDNENENDKDSTNNDNDSNNNNDNNI